jgi:hypothetical protein
MTRSTEARPSYLLRGLVEAGGKLSLFDQERAGRATTASVSLRHAESRFKQSGHGGLAGPRAHAGGLTAFGPDAAAAIEGDGENDTGRRFCAATEPDR